MTEVSERILREIDEGNPGRPSLRARLHRIESKDAAVTMLADELRRLTAERVSRAAGWREWLVTMTAVVGVVVGQHFWN